MQNLKPICHIEYVYDETYHYTVKQFKKHMLTRNFGNYNYCNNTNASMLLLKINNAYFKFKDKINECAWCRLIIIKVSSLQTYWEYYPYEARTALSELNIGEHYKYESEFFIRLK